jgi:SAM-dependent methyltransferase
MPPNKYALYEQSVQSPETHARFFVQIYQETHDRYPRRLREDFCGTFRLATEWVRRNRRNHALALDLDPEPLAYGRRANRRALTPEQRSRLEIRRADVATVTTPRADVIAACNFSFFAFKRRAQLLGYLRAARRSLAPGGLLVLEMAGGPGMLEKVRERKAIYRGGKRAFSYVWDQRSFDPITRDARYEIHFEFPNGRAVRSAFTYDWRLWTVPELRDALADAGFATSWVYWETTHRGQGTGEWARAERGDNAYSWIAYVVAARESPVRRGPRPPHRGSSGGR